MYLRSASHTVTSDKQLNPTMLSLPSSHTKHFDFQVAEASRRLIQLQQLLGNQEDVDIVWMLVREPA